MNWLQEHELNDWKGECNTLSGPLALFSYFPFFFFFPNSLILAHLAVTLQGFKKSERSQRNLVWKSKHMTVMYFPRGNFISIKQTVIHKADCTGRESKHILLFSFVWAFHPKGAHGHNLLGGTHKQSLNSRRLDEQLKEDLMSRDAHPFNNTTCYPHKKISPKSFLSRCVVSDSDSHRGYKLSSVPLSRLSPRQQRGGLLYTQMSLS